MPVLDDMAGIRVARIATIAGVLAAIGERVDAT